MLIRKKRVLLQITIQAVQIKELYSGTYMDYQG